MKLYIGLIATVLLFSRCRECGSEVNYGERVLIPVQFEDFTLQEINEMRAIRIDRSNPSDRDSFDFKQIMAPYAAHNYSTQITDRPQNGAKFGDYESYLNNSDLILIWRNNMGSDTLSNIVIRKSKAEADKCHKDDPNVRVDEVSFVFEGKTYTKNQVITMTKD
jgi:hypothetical protein